MITLKFTPPPMDPAFSQYHASRVSARTRASTRWTSIPWQSVNWSMSNQEIARILEIAPNYVSAARQFHRPETSVWDKTCQAPGCEWLANVDWSLTDSQIKSTYAPSGYPLSFIPTYRRLHAEQSSPIMIRNHTKELWLSVDWSRSNTDLEIFTGFSKAMIHMMRCILAPKTLADRAAKRGRDWSKIDWMQSTSSISRSLGVDPSTVSVARRKYAPHTMHGNIDGGPSVVDAVDVPASDFADRKIV